MKNKTVRFQRLAVLFSVATLVSGIVAVPIAKADKFDDQINQLQSQNVKNKQAVNALQGQANSYQDAISKLTTQIDALQAAILANERQSVDLERQITEAQAELDHQKQVLGENIRAMYLAGEISTLEMLASSKDLSEFLDKQQYRNSVQQKVTDTLDKVNALKIKLKEQQQQLQDLIKAQQAQRADVAAQQQKQSELLAYTQAQQAQFNTQINANNTKIADLRKQQIAANLANSRNVTYGGCGNYPDEWCNASQDSRFDDWGMYNRECVSYTAWRVHQDYLLGKNKRDMPGWGWAGLGNAYQWIQNARNAGIAVNSTPEAGAIAVRDRDPSRGYWFMGQWTGDVGHVMYVEYTFTGSDGQQWIHLSQYNAALDGRYSTADKPAAGLYYLHF